MNVNEESRQQDKNLDVAPLAPPGVVLLATICAATQEGKTKIKLAGSGLELVALSSQTFTHANLHETVACIGIPSNDLLLIIGTVSAPDTALRQTHSKMMLDQLLNSYHQTAADESDLAQDEAELLQGAPGVDIEEEVVIAAGRALTIKCGASSITLTADGRVNIRGKFVTNSASQLNRLTGGSVKIN